MTILDPQLMAERAPAIIEENLRMRDLIRRIRDRMPGLGNTELMVEIDAVLTRNR